MLIVIMAEIGHYRTPSWAI